MIRVDHAGEYGAARIYAGQLAVLRPQRQGRRCCARCRHRSSSISTRFADLIASRRVRPTAMLPLWHLAGFALGAATAALGRARGDGLHGRGRGGDRRALCRPDRRAGRRTRPSCATRSRQFRDEELQHRDIGLQHEARAGARLPAAVGGDQGRLQGGDPGQRADIDRFAINGLRVGQPSPPVYGRCWGGLAQRATVSSRHGEGLGSSALQFAIPVQIVAPALVQVVGREGAAVVLQLPCRRLAGAGAREHARIRAAGGCPCADCSRRRR